MQLKGRVACEISGHELIITELIFHNMLTPLHPTEIAAVLSSVVFQQRRRDYSNDQSTLKHVRLYQRMRKALESYRALRSCYVSFSRMRKAVENYRLASNVLVDRHIYYTGRPRTRRYRPEMHRAQLAVFCWAELRLANTRQLLLKYKRPLHQKILKQA